MGGKKGVLYLIPTVIADDSENEILSKSIIDSIQKSDRFLVENIRTARRFLSKIFKSLPDDKRRPIEEVDFEILNKNTGQDQIESLMKPLKNGQNIGIISESGAPGIADPGAEAVKWAQRNEFEVIPVPGPSSIFMALMASGLNGQSFAFHGYLPIDKSELKQKIRAIEEESRKLNRTQIFIETPYRNLRTFEALTNNLSSTVMLTVAYNIMGKNQMIQTKSISNWKIHKPSLKKDPCVFLIQSDSY